jgi:hypothetical protein
VGSQNTWCRTGKDTWQTGQVMPLYTQSITEGKNVSKAAWVSQRGRKRHYRNLALSGDSSNREHEFQNGVSGSYQKENSVRMEVGAERN